MASVFQPPPTWAPVILTDESSKISTFNPVWLKWFVDLVALLNQSGGGGGTITHNSLAGLQGGAVNEFYHLSAAAYAQANTVSGSTYTPTLTAVTNVAASTAYQCQYLRAGNTVFVSGRVDVDPTAAGAVELGISLPIASNFGGTEDCGGAAAAFAVAGQSAAILADATNDRASMQWVAVDTANRGMMFSFGYQVI